MLESSELIAAASAAATTRPAMPDGRYSVMNQGMIDSARASPVSTAAAVGSG